MIKNTSLLFLCWVIALLFIHCDDDESAPVIVEDYERIDVVTGMFLTDQNALPIGTWRSPNAYREGISVYPNPGDGVVSVFTQSSVSQVWIVAADCVKDTSGLDIPTLAKDLAFTTAELDDNNISKPTIPAPGDDFTLNLTSLEKGFYRIFMEMSTGEIYWENIFIEPDFPGFPVIDTLDTFCP